VPAQARLALRGMTKRYGVLLANDAIDLDVWPGAIHAVLGENGAGKSTLMKAIYGVVQADAGRMWLDGVPYTPRSPADARSFGIGMVFQHFALFESLSVAENIWLGLDRRWSLAEVIGALRKLQHTYKLHIDPEAMVHRLSVGERQRVEICRALLGEPRILILDEPTSVLSPQATLALFEMLRLLAAQGCSMIYISHKLHEIRSLCNDCTVLRGGRVSGRLDPRRSTEAELSACMIGAPPPPLVRASNPEGRIMLRICGLTLVADEVQSGSSSPGSYVSSGSSHALRDIALDLRAGEILGIAGVSGNGQAALLNVLSGETRQQPAPAPRLSGTLELEGRDVLRLGVGERRSLGLHALPEERLGRATVPELALSDNMLLAGSGLDRRWWLDFGALRRAANAVIERFMVRAQGSESAVRSLSGGNLQKYIVGRTLGKRPKVLVISQPTWGVDVGASTQIRQQLLALRDAGTAIIVISEELDELFQLADRIQVIATGELSPSMAIDQASVERIGSWMGGGWRETQA
jgi:simple sugar transport system ATP-binding protein